ncbi:hypothetical protein B6D60_12085 [candidate division KSB1 bacterium 4484_87]|nr:MAG: hypothetical protein B6D60_12085 [candidate division KSB1 bacterium 4484_87]
MSKFEQFLYRHLKLLRRSVQIAILLLMIAIPILNRHQINFVIGTFYSISIGHLDFADPTIVLQTILLHKSIYLPLLLAGILPLIIAMIFGRIFCSWMCPFNAMAEFIYWLRYKIKGRKARNLKEVPNPRQYPFWISFGISTSILMVFGIPLFTYVSAPGIISSQIADLLFSSELGLEVLLIFIILLIEFLFSRRLWCKYFCPIGIFLSLFRYKHTMQVQFDESKCIGNEKSSPCNAVCQFKLNPKKAGTFPFCHNCGDCVNICQNKYGKALSFSFHKKLNNQDEHKTTQNFS